MKVRIIFVFAILLGLTRVIWAGDAVEKSEKTVCPVTGKTAEAAATKCPFVGDAEIVNNANCPVDGMPIDGKTFKVYDGKVYGFCSDMCVPKFEENPDNYTAPVKSE